VSLSSFSNPDLVGIWQAQYGRRVEILVFNKDGTYLQIYEDTTGFLYTNDASNWETKKDTSGRVFVHLSSGLWFPEGAKTALLKGVDFQGALHQFYDPKTNQFITMHNELILEVVPRSNSKGFVLFQFMYNLDSDPAYFEPVIK
jgi:hypothetical protein